MLKDVTLGQYFPGNSIFHKTDPRIKLLLTVAYIVAIFLAKSGAAYALLLLVSILITIMSGIRLSVILKGIKPLIFVVIITAIINVFWYSPPEGTEPLFSFWKINIYLGGLLTALYMAIRILCLILGTGVVLTYTTSPIALTDAIESLLSPLKLIKLPVHEFSMMMTIALRFIPTLIEETDKIMSAQKARGADFSSGGLIKRAKALLPVLVPLFISAFRRADELAVAMECRCYRGGKGRTKMTRRTLRPYDFILVIFFGAFIAGVVLINKYIPFYTV
ncbi:MAG: energy-coupling factor transporter transmembrane component T [Eubacteriales bacterium]|nr:energy-coupling factor transporter transmembrane protein EcfT [Eubacteriales bacterium]MDD7573267.1 energy-coupling factor transporter transmembrane component T [Eubacteriales bacterium]